MPISVVVGGQFGSEGKGKVALAIARLHHAIAAVRVGGTNSGHTVVRRDGEVCAFRQLPAAATQQVGDLREKLREIEGQITTIKNTITLPARALPPSLPPAGPR
jgi:hypothetical protein